MIELLSAQDLDVEVTMPEEINRLASQGLTNLTPWHIMSRDLAQKRMKGLRARYRTKYVPFAKRQDNDDLACIDPNIAGRVVIVHDFSSEGSEHHAIYDNFWSWFRAAVEDMISFA
jgi:hypothetical protein